MSLYDILEWPPLHNAVQKVLSGGRETCITRHLAAHVPVGPGQRLLDVGCGPGRHAARFAGVYVGLDRSRSYCRAARSRVRGRAGRHFIVGDMTRTPFRDAAFDWIICLGVLHHLPDRDVVASLNEMRRLLAPGGLCLVYETIPPVNARNLAGRAIMALDRGRYVRREPALKALVAQCGLSEYPHQIQPADSFPAEARIYAHTAPRTGTSHATPASTSPAR